MDKRTPSELISIRPLPPTHSPEDQPARGPEIQIHPGHEGPGLQSVSGARQPIVQILGFLLPSTEPQLLHLYRGYRKRASFIGQLGQDQVTVCGQATLLSMMTGQLLLDPSVPSIIGPGEGVAHGLGPKHPGWAGRGRGPSWAGHKATEPASAPLSVKLIKGRRPPWPRSGPLPSYLPWGRQGPS